MQRGRGSPGISHRSAPDHGKPIADRCSPRRPCGTGADLPGVSLRLNQTSHTRTPSASDVNGSRVGTNSCPMYPSKPVSLIARMIAG
jgi:hypothetical protein